MGVRDLNVFPLYGTRKNTGSVAGPLFPTNGIPILVASIGTDSTQTGTAAGTTKNGTLASAVIGATTLTYTITNSTPTPSIGDYYQIGPAVSTFGSWTAPNPTGASQVVGPVSAVSGSGPYTLTVPAIPVAVASSAVAQNAVAPFYHNVVQANSLPSLTIEKNVGGYESLFFTGARVGKYSLKCQASDTEAAFTADVTAKGCVPSFASGSTPISTTLATTALVQGTVYTSVTTAASVTVTQGQWLRIINASVAPYTSQFVCASSNYTGTTVPVDGFVANAAYPVTTTTITNAPPTTPINVINELPFIFAEANVLASGWASANIAQITNVQMDIDNGLKPTYTMNNTHDLQFLTPVTRHITGQFDVVFTSYDDPNWGFFNDIANQVGSSLVFQFVHPQGANANWGVQFTLSNIQMGKYSDAIKLTDVVMSTINYEANYNLNASTPTTIGVVIADGQSAPY